MFIVTYYNQIFCNRRVTEAETIKFSKICAVTLDEPNIVCTRITLFFVKM